MKFSLVKSRIPVICLRLCLFGAMYTFLTFISHYLNSIFKCDLSFQPLEICKNLALIAFVLNSQFHIVLNCERPTFQVSELLVHSERKQGGSLEVETCLKTSAALRAQPVPSAPLLSMQCWIASRSQEASSDPYAISRLFCLQTFSKAEDGHLTQAQPSRDAGGESTLLRAILNYWG